MQQSPNHSEIKRIAFIGNYLPRQCGIATFTTDLCEAIAAGHTGTACITVPVNDIEGGYAYPPRVRFELTEKDLESYRGAADFLNINSDANKIGLSPPPIETPHGWLVIYHGVRQTAAGSVYRLGLALFDLQALEHCIKRGEEWIFGPQEVYKQRGDIDNVVFPCGYTLLPDGDSVHLYYGAADTSIAVASGSLHAILEWLQRQGCAPAATIENRKEPYVS